MSFSFFSTRSSRTLCSLALLLGAASTWAQSEVSALGWTLQTSTVEQLRQAYPEADHRGTNRFSDGPMFSVPTSRFDLMGLESTLFIFDDGNRLAAIILTMSKSRFNAIHDTLKDKYPVRASQIPFVGNSYVRYGAPGATIELDAPHLSFSMDLRYQRDDFVARFKQRVNEDEAARQRREKDQL